MNLKFISGLAAGLAIWLVSVAAHAKADATDNMLEQGAQDYRVHCASCHGMDAQGDGPVSPFLVRKPPDLTTLEARHGGEFPVDAVYWVIDGRGDVAAHGPREMPVWGEQFGGPGQKETMTQERILNIIAYLKTLQRGIPANPVPKE